MPDPEPWLTIVLSLMMGLAASMRGGEPERLTALLIIASIVAYTLSRALLGNPAYFSVYPGGLIIDLWLLAALMWIGVRANRGWPLAVAALQMVVVLGHLAKIVDGAAARMAYYFMTHVPFPLQMILVTMGSLTHGKRVQRIGWYHPWRLT